MVNKILKWIAIIAVLLLFGGIISNKNNTIEKLSQNIINKEYVINSYELERDSLMNEIIIQNRTISELNTSKDEINKKLMSKIHELNLKNDRITELEYLSQKASKRDSIFIKDTIFVDNFTLDTVIVDDWYRLHMTMMFPNLVVINPEFNSELIITKYYDKEYFGAPKKCWIGRLFQKKILVEKVNITENSPYIKTTIYRDIKITE